MEPHMASDDILRRFWSFTRGRSVLARRFRLFGDAALTLDSPQQQRTTPAIASTLARGYASESKAQPTEVSSILEQRIRGVQEDTGLAETGRVLTVGYDGTTQQRTWRTQALTYSKVTVSLVSTA
jgi:hypothetical protein